jgi:choline-sulfatase
MHKRPPNIVWICADDFTPAMCGAYGNSIVRTPAIDGLASRGVRFDRAYCTCPLSTPSRQSFWTGRYPRSIGVTLSPTALPDDELSLPTMLRRAGYQTAAFGKTHFYRPQRDQFSVSLDYSDYLRWFAARGGSGSNFSTRTLGPWRPFLDPAAIWLNSDSLPFPAIDAEMFGTYLSNGAAEYLRRQATAPFFLYVSYFETHSPFAFPVEFAGRHSSHEFQVPHVNDEDWRRAPPVFQELGDYDVCGIQNSYATCAEFMDKNVGIVLDALAASVFERDTIVLFTSDHGYLLGQHGRFEKHCCYEEAIRATLIMRLPDSSDEKRSVEGPVQLMDLVPTLLELCGLPVPSNVQAHSFLPLLRGDHQEHRRPVFIEYSDNAEAAVIDGKWKAIYTTNRRRRRDGYGLEFAQSGPFIQLFNLDADPQELSNLANESKHRPILNRLLHRLAQHLVQTDRRGRGTDLAGIEDVFEACLDPVELVRE